MKRCLSLVCALVMLVTGIGTGTLSYAVVHKDVAEAQISFDKASYTYTGSEIKPDVTVTLNGTTLVKDSDYEVAFSANINAGEGRATVTGKGEYTGTNSKTFTINPIKIANSKAEFTRTKKATPGSAPVYTVKFDGKTLTEGTDYDVVVSNIDKAGVMSGTIQFQGKGNFTNTKTIKINVFPETVTGIKTVERKTGSIKLEWNSQKGLGVTGYKIYTCKSDGSEIDYVKTVKSNSATVSGLKNGTYYYFMVRALVENDGEKVHGDYSTPYLSCTRPGKVEIRSVAKAKSGDKLVIRWIKTPSTGYEIQYTTDKKFKKNVKTVTVKAGENSKKVSIPENKKVYYARIRAYRKYNHEKTTIRGAWSVKMSTNYGNLYAKYVCHYPDKPARNHNLAVACKAINGTIVYPGEVFSFNKVVGVRSPSKGYKMAPVYQGPNVVTTGYGGGVCQVASTVFNTALLANFEIVERHQHSQRVHYGKLGRDATVYYGSQDFKFRNSSDYPIKIKMYLGNQCVRCYFYTCYDVKPRKVKLTVTQNGKHFKLTRSVAGKVNYTTYSTY